MPHHKPINTIQWERDVYNHCCEFTAFQLRGGEGLLQSRYFSVILCAKHNCWMLHSYSKPQSCTLAVLLQLKNRNAFNPLPLIEWYQVSITCRPTIFGQVQDNEAPLYTAFPSKGSSPYFLMVVFSELRHSFLPFLTLLDLPIGCGMATSFAHIL